MTTKKELNDLLSAYESYIGGGNMKQAGRTLPKIIHALVQFVEERTPDIVTEYDTSSAPLGNMKPDKAKAFFDAYRNPEPCEPCDVSIPDNDALIEDFKIIPPSTKTAISKKEARNSLTIAFGHASKAIAENKERSDRIRNNWSEPKTAKSPEKIADKKEKPKPPTEKKPKAPLVKKPKK